MIIMVMMDDDADDGDVLVNQISVCAVPLVWWCCWVGDSGIFGRDLVIHILRDTLLISFEFECLCIFVKSCALVLLHQILNCMHQPLVSHNMRDCLFVMH
jgi:hypothetical protein